MTTLIRLYPRRWRERYGPELEQLVALRPATIRDRVDLVRGAIDAHRRPDLVDPSAPRPLSAGDPVTPSRLADLRVARRLGIVAMAGPILWFAAWIVAVNGPIVHDGDAVYRDGGAALPIYFASMWALVAAFVGQLIRLPRRAIVARLAALCGVVGFAGYAFGPWLVPLGLTGLGAVLFLTLAAWWGGHWSTATVLLGVGAVIGALAWAFAMTFGIGGVDPLHPDPASLVAILTGVSLMWLAVGLPLLTLPPVDPALAGDASLDSVPGPTTA